VAKLDLGQLQIAGQLVDNRATRVPEGMKTTMPGEPFNSSAIHGWIKNAVPNDIWICRRTIPAGKK